jgi:hypothetical protein
MKRQLSPVTLSTVALLGTLAGFTAPAFAQEPGASPPPAQEMRRTSRTSGDIANGGLGVGGTVFASGLAGPEVVYDFGAWHLDGMLTFANWPQNGAGDRGTTVAFGVGGWYHLHMGESSDFSVGGAFALANASPPGANNDRTGFEFEPGAQIRAFITPNVALHGGVALVLAFGDQVGAGSLGSMGLNKQIALDASFTGNLGFTYYFR